METSSGIECRLADEMLCGRKGLAPEVYILDSDLKGSMKIEAYLPEIGGQDALLCDNRPLNKTMAFDGQPIQPKGVGQSH
jgi:hypothetical protein